MLTDNQGRPATLVGTGPVSAYLARLAPRSRRTYLGDARAIADILFGRHQDPLSYRAESDVDRLGWHALGVEQGVALCARLAASYAPSTARRMVACYRGILRECWRQGRMSAEALARAIDLPAVRGERVGRGRALTWAEVERLLAAAQGFNSRRDRAMLAVMVGAGLRRAEVVALRASDALREDVLLVQGKGRRQRRVRLPNWAVAHLRAYWREADLERASRVFRLEHDGSVDAIVRRTAARAGLGPLGAHDLRRTYASLALGAGMPLASLARAMGHSKVTTTMIYDRRPDEDVLAEAGRLDNGLEPK